MPTTSATCESGITIPTEALTTCPVLFHQGAAAILLAVLLTDWWIGVTAVFVAFRSLGGFVQARHLARMEHQPRREEAACPACDAHPHVGAWWTCEQCRQPFDAIAHREVCPACGSSLGITGCPE